MKIFKKKITWVIVAVLILITIIFFSVRAKAQNNINNQKFNTKTETVITPQRKKISDQITLSGSVDAASKTDLRFQTSGQLAWVGVKVGDKVKKYQAIASLNKEELKKQLQIDFNNYKTTASTFYDTSDKYKDTVIDTEMRRILDRSQNTLDNSVINYELGDLTVKYATLTTPIAGIVTNVDQPNSGVNISPATATFSIIDPKSIYLKSQIDQEDVIKIKVGDKTTVRLDSFSDQTFDSKITYISYTPISGQTSTVYEVRFELPKDNDDLKYKIGMDGDAIITLKENQNSLVIPIDALTQTESESYVLVKNPDDNQLIKKIVKTGIETDTEIEILEGLSENDQVIIKK